MMRMELSLRMEIHDDACVRCLTPKASNRECGPCAMENATIVSAGTLGSACRAIDESENARNERRKENS